MAEKPIIQAFFDEPTNTLPVPRVTVLKEH